MDTNDRKQELLHLITQAHKYGNTAYAAAYEAELRALTKGAPHA